MTWVGDPQGTQARAMDVEREQHPAKHTEEPPASFRRAQVIALIVLIAVVAILVLLPRWL